MAWAALAPALWTYAAVQAVRRAAAGAGSAVMSLRQQLQQQLASIPPPTKRPFFCDRGGEEQQPFRLPAGHRGHAAIPWRQIPPPGPGRLPDHIAAAATAAPAGCRTREYGASFPPTPQPPSPLPSASATGSNSCSGRCSNCSFHQRQDQKQQGQQQQQQNQGQKQPHWRQDAHACELTPVVLMGLHQGKLPRSCVITRLVAMAA